MDGLTCVGMSLAPGELVLLSEFAAEPELAVDIPMQNAKHLTLLFELADDADSDFEFDVSLLLLSFQIVLPSLAVVKSHELAPGVHPGGYTNACEICVIVDCAVTKTNVASNITSVPWLLAVIIFRQLI
jgi:hypothetical protein